MRPARPNGRAYLRAFGAVSLRLQKSLTRGVISIYPLLDRNCATVPGVKTVEKRFRYYESGPVKGKLRETMELTGDLTVRKHRLSTRRKMTRRKRKRRGSQP